MLSPSSRELLRVQLCGLCLLATICLFNLAPNSTGRLFAAQLGERCRSSGPPPQWRPHLDAASKAYLAPAIAIATLKQCNFAPIQLGGRTSAQAAEQPLAFHAQNINNNGVNIEVTFKVHQQIKAADKSLVLLRNSTIKLVYRVSASLSTTSDIIALANSVSASQVSGQQQALKLLPAETLHSAGGRAPQLAQRASSGENQLAAGCALELSESELVKKGGKLFKLGQDYVVFLDRQQPLGRLAQSSQRQQAVGRQFAQLQPHAFATHEPLSNQTGRSINRTLCRNCGKLFAATRLASFVGGQFSPSRALLRVCRRVERKRAPKAKLAHKSASLCFAASRNQANGFE